MVMLNLMVLMSFKELKQNKNKYYCVLGLQPFLTNGDSVNLIEVLYNENDVLFIK